MGVLKKYVHNRARPEGSISKGHENEEVIEFCIDFIPDLKPIGVPESRHKGRLEGKGALGGHQIICMDGHSLTEAHYIVLQNSALVAPYMEEHKNFLQSKHPEKSDDWITREQTRTFAGWLQKRALKDGDIQNDLYSLS